MVHPQRGKSSAHNAPVVVQHERHSHVVGERPHLCLAEQILQQREDARSQDAELGEMAKTMRAASAQAGKAVPLSRHQERMAFE